MKRTLWLASLSLTAAFCLTAANAGATCVGGSKNGVLEAGEQCDDPGTCCAADCTFVASGVACDDFNDCSRNTKCDGSGDCGGGSANPSGTLCHDYNPDGSFASCQMHACSGRVCTPAVVSDLCTDNNPCTQDICHPATQTCEPTHPPLSAGTVCDTDGSACTLEKCNDVGACLLISTTDCSGQPDPGVCKFNTCDPASGGCTVLNRPKGTTCTSDNNMCTDDECNSTGTCKHFNVDTGTPCDDGNVCSVGESCYRGTCGGNAANAGGPANDGRACPDDGNVCTFDYCVQGTTTCGHSVTAYTGGGTTNGLACNDNDACTSDSSCSNGACTGTACVGSGGCGDCGNTACNNTLPRCGCP
jgi:hypothetical protein